ncbi:hypothetical protein DTO013E5_2784 [Penicillium roqueforti]|uniref:uncharacterized protein n=1 Tax=Penicillium roqueforti TaxID=5082 RepID=UPI0019097727|nr:uncharacterized protein LCP9604111_4553 [Penicillium roqueforti]KAF9249397.1 hypothetical protein LCP9604111_4553 [Penicillium roqueforti]KAI1834091.1 hypothetical protein CBS147337_5055 [Penicillium roqueforti]KAI2674881.1 hypothetical protein CBS147355_6695 [Penicillium roqueforti]KAI2687911.1 hypothetical protein LCP963914a_3429 [Penicillium roqueforti]KAI2699849.1 hypothetical protein CBS147372_6159 [Penicillium roqueforti]
MATIPETNLGAFIRLAPSVYLQDPPNPSEKADRPVIFIAFWMNAPPRALAKYVVEYRGLVPSARIIFVRSSSSDFIWRLRAQTRRARVTPAVEAMRGLVTPENPVFVHLFSNGGMSSTTHLLQAWKNATGTPLPISAMILDSAPGSPSLRAGLKAFSFALPQMWILRLLGKGFIFAFLVLFKLIHSFSMFPDPISLARELINDTSLVRAANSDGTLSRCYIYSDTDDLVDWRDVESHAVNAEAEGWVVRREVFKNSPHVGHMRTEPDRYWGIVREYLGALVSV